MRGVGNSPPFPFADAFSASPPMALPPPLPCPPPQLGESDPRAVLVRGIEDWCIAGGDFTDAPGVTADDGSRQVTTQRRIRIPT